MATPEGIITKQIKMYLEGLACCWFFKVSDRFTSGIPDFIGCYRGRFFAIEVKRQGGKPRMLQEYIIDKIKSAGGLAGTIDNISDIENFFDF